MRRNENFWRFCLCHGFPRLFYNQISIGRCGSPQMGRMIVPDKTIAGKVIPPVVQTRTYALCTVIWVFIVLRPHGWVGFDVLGDIVHFALIADDVFVIISLPDGDSVRAAQTIDPFCNDGFELCHHRAQ